jgi:hypothetical protein
VPPGFSGWWCGHCEQGCPKIPDFAEGTQKCPRCHKWTVVWVPGGQIEEYTDAVESVPTKQDRREYRERVRASAAELFELGRQLRN